MATPANSTDANTSPPSRHRADDDLDQLASGAFAPAAPSFGLGVLEEDVDENAPLEMDYGSDDDVSVEDDGIADLHGVELSRRTGMLMNSFQDYVDTMEGEGKGDTGCANRDVEAGQYSDGTPLIEETLTFRGKGQGLLRDFVIREDDTTMAERDDYDDRGHNG